jgi:hypothetical protein
MLSEKEKAIKAKEKAIKAKEKEKAIKAKEKEKAIKAKEKEKAIKAKEKEKAIKAKEKAKAKVIKAKEKEKTRKAKIGATSGGFLDLLTPKNPHDTLRDQELEAARQRVNKKNAELLDTSNCDDNIKKLKAEVQKIIMLMNDIQNNIQNLIAMFSSVVSEFNGLPAYTPLVYARCISPIFVELNNIKENLLNYFIQFKYKDVELRDLNTFLQNDPDYNTVINLVVTGHRLLT